MDNQRRDYGEFFNRPKEQPGSRADEETDKATRESYYYSYGPFKSSVHDDKTTMTSTDSYGSEEVTSVDISAPTPVKPYSISQGYAAPGMNGWEYRETKKKSSFKSVTAAFLAGALVVSGLMFASDKMNLFTADADASSSGSGGAGSKAIAANYGGGSGGGVTTAAVTGMRPDNIADIVANTSPAVVKIETYVNSANNGRRNNSFFNDDDIFRYFFGDDFFAPPSGGGNNGRQAAGMGTGFFFDKEGYILTNEHVIAGADEIEVVVEGHKEKFKAELLGTAPELDLAVVKINGEDDFPTLPIGDSDALRVGDWVTAIGNPIGFDHTVSVGVLSAKEREISIPDQGRTRVYKHLLQTDASINPGNSGGPLLNLNGEVIGINTAVSAQAQGIGFAIPTSTVLGVLENLKNNVKIPVPFVGVEMQNIEEAWLKELQLDSTEGVLVRSVVRNSPADKAGLRPYDVITEINGTKIKDSQEFSDQVRKMKVGDKITLTVVRDGTNMTTGVTIEDRNEF